MKKAISKTNRMELSLNDLANIIKNNTAVIETKIASLVIKLDTYDSNIASLKCSIDNLSISITDLKSENVTLRNEINILRNRVLSLESSSNLSQTISQIDIVHETQLRLQKAKNVIFFNIDKPDSSESQIPLETAKELVSVLNIQVPILATRWIGKISLKSRPLLVELNDTNSVLKVIKLKSKLRTFEKWRQVWASPDLTLIQQNHMKKLRDELTRHRDQGESKLIIKYINGNPSICPKN